MSDIILTLVGKPSCHLCDDARLVVDEVVAKLQPAGDVTAPSAAPTGVPRLIVEERSIEDDRELFDKYWEQIPVLLINGKIHNFWRIDPVRLTASLKGLL